MNIKLNVSGLFNILTIILVITLLCTVGACSPRNHIQVMQQQRQVTQEYINGDCAGDLSLATCDNLIHKGVNNQKFIMIR